MQERATAATAMLLLVFGAGAARAQDLGTEQQRASGKQLYDKYCAQCHGVNGDGNGPATGRVKPAPRDFTSGKYKFRTTPSGMLPTDADIRRVIREGLPYTSMPAWPSFTDTEVQNIIYYLKTFSADFEDPSKYADPIDIPEPPPVTDESIQKGRTVYESQGCAACHGDQGRGDGLSAPTLKDDWGHHIRPADMTQRWTFRGGPTRKDVFRTFSTGLNGTPMPSYFDSLAVEDRWDLVNYIDSLGSGDEPDYSNLLIVEYLDDEIDLSRGPELFATAPVSRFPLLGQIVEPGRDFHPLVTSVEVQAVYNRQEIAFLVRWHDMRADRSGTNDPAVEVPLWDEDQHAPASDEQGQEGDDFWGEEAVDEGGDDFWGEEAAGEGGDDFWGEGGQEGGAGAGAAAGFSDAVAMQFPSALPTGIRKPYFIYGDVQSAVDLWFVDLARPSLVRQYTARGRDSVDPSTADDFELASDYDKGEWHVIYKRDLRSTGNVTFQEDQFVPVAFSVWDGFNRERGNKRALSAWFYLYVEPVEEISAIGPMVKTAVAVLLVELILIFWIRRRFASAEPEPASPRGALPHGGLAK